MRLTRFLLTSCCCCFLLNLSAQWEWEGAEFSNLDLGYPLNGLLFIDNENHDDSFLKMVIQSDGKILVLGHSRNLENRTGHHLLMRIDLDGSLDTTFGDKGKLYLPTDNQNVESSYGNYGDVALQAENKILVVGRVTENYRHDLLLLRYTIDGVLDTSFGTEGKLILKTEESEGGFNLCIQENDEILVAGSRGSGILVQRFNMDGKSDTSFAQSGYALIDFGEGGRVQKILLQKDGKILLIGSTNSYQKEKNDFALARLLPNGELDVTFGQHGKVTTTIGSGKAAHAADGLIQADGKIIVVGSAMATYQPDYAMVRYNSDGTLDKTFGNRGKVITNVSKFGDHAVGLVRQADGQIIVTGTSQEWAAHLTLIRYTADGKLDYSFGEKGKQRPYFGVHGSGVKSIKLLDDKIILGGNLRLESRPNSDLLLIRFLTDLNVGTITLSQNPQETFVYPNPIQETATLKYVLEKPENLTIQLMDINGRLLKTYLQNELQQAGSYQQQIDLPIYLSTGVYFLKMTSASGQLSIKVTKSN